MLDKVIIASDSISLVRGLKKQIVVIPWNHVVKIHKVRNVYPEVLHIESDIIKDGKPYLLVIKSRYEIEEVLSEYHKISIDTNIESL